MVKEAKPKAKRGPNKGETKKAKSTMSARKLLDREYKQLLKSKKDIDDKIKNYDEIFKLMGGKAKKKATKTETKTEATEKIGKKRGPKPKQPIIIAESSAPKTEDTALSS